MLILRRFGCLLAAFTCILLATVTAAADNPLSSYNPDATASIVIHKYEVDDLGDYIIAADGSELDGSTVVVDNGGSGDVTLGTLQPLSGIPFRITLMEVLNPDGDLSAVSNYQKASPETFFTGTTNTAGEINFNDGGKGLAHGVWLVEELPNSTVETTIPDFLVRVPMTDPADRSSWLYEVHVYPKNEIASAPGIDKNIVDENGDPITDPRDLGNVLTWQIAVELPAEIEDAQALIVTDTLDSRLVYDAASLKVGYADKDGNATALTSGTHFSAGVNASTNQLTVTILDPAGFQELAQSQTGTGTSQPVLRIVFDTRINIQPEQGDSYDLSTIYNGAELEYTNDGGYTYTPGLEDGEKPGVDVGALHIKKVDGTNGSTPLVGATFQLYRTENDANNGVNALTDPATGSTVWTQTSDSTGFASFYGLNYGTYYLVETAAPSGYNLLTAPVPVTVDADSGNKEFALTVKNFKGFTLPVTGGAGTAIFTVSGLVLLGVAAALLLTRRGKGR